MKSTNITIPMLNSLKGMPLVAFDFFQGFLRFSTCALCNDG